MKQNFEGINELHARWSVICATTGITQCDHAWEQVCAGYGSPSRHYHGWRHINQCLVLLDELRSFAVNPQAIETAIWFHDVIYDSTRHDNEERSAMLAGQYLRGLPLADSVMKLIMATTHKSAPVDQDAALLCDIDLSILGSEPIEYDAYSKAVRREYEWVSADKYRAARAQVMRTFLTRSAIYSVQFCRERWEAKARCNITHELKMLEVQINSIE